jgi:hypothetical protein
MKKQLQVIPVNDEFNINSKEGSLLGSVENPENSTDPLPQDRSGNGDSGVQQSADAAANQPDSGNVSGHAPKKSPPPVKRVLGPDE